MRDSFGIGGSSQGVSRMFDELTNQEDGEEGPKGEKREELRGSKVERERDTETKWGGDEFDELLFDGV
jgi:histone demethylase JARID1